MSQYEWSNDDLSSGGNWDSRILGSIATNLTQLRTWDQAIKELVQNADDAKATEISFSISDTGITVFNDQLMTHCEYPNEKYTACNFESESKNDFCDVHAIKTLSSQNKKKNSDATGKFGIGFVSVFLFTDQPEISSGNLRMIFLPAEDRIPVKLVSEHQNGTNLYLPWAQDSESQVRIGLEKPAIELEQIPGIVSEIVDSCIRSFIFVRNLRKIRVSLNSKVVLHLTRQKNEDEIIITDKLQSKSTTWLLLKSDSKSEATLETLRKSDPNFESRRTLFEILIPTEIQDGFSGLLYATLATNQRTYLPFHVNADFYPDTSRNNLSFKDRGNERDPAALWNRSVISQCARFVAGEIPKIHELVGNAIVWQMFKGSYAISKQKTGEIVPECFNDFWIELKKIGRITSLIENQNNVYCLPTEINLLVPHNKKHSAVMNELDLSYQIETDSIYLEICRELGAVSINQNAISKSLLKMRSSGQLSDFLADSEIADSLFSLIEKTLQTEIGLIDELQELSIWPTFKHQFRDFISLNRLPDGLDQEIFSCLFPNLVLSSKVFSSYPSLQDELNTIMGDALVSFLREESTQNSFLTNEFFKDDSQAAFDFLFRCLVPDALSVMSIDRLREMEIWPHSNGQFMNLANSTLPGSFVDPIGVGQLIDRGRLGELATNCLIRNLHVKEMSLKVYVLDLLPTYFSTKTLSPVSAQELTIQFVDNQQDLDETMLEKLKSFPIVLTQGSKVEIPTNCLYPSESLQKICSDRFFNFVDLSVLGSLKYKTGSQLESFLRKIGIIFDPTFGLLVSSWEQIQNDTENRDLEFQRLSDLTESFFDIWQKKSKITRLSEGAPSTANLLWPCKNGCKSWHPAFELIQSKWCKVICVEENLHEVGVTFGKRTRESIEELFLISNKPEMFRVKQHLEHCITETKHPGDVFYRYLNWLSDQGEPTEKQQVEFLKDAPLIFKEGENTFWVPKDIYGVIPRHLEFLADFVHFVEKAPKGLESLWGVLGIGTATEQDVVRYLPNIKDEIINSNGSEIDLTKYLSALSIIGTAFEAGDPWAQSFLDEFKESEFLLTLSSTWIQPKFGVIPDNRDWAESLQKYFASNLVRSESASYEFLIAAGAQRLTDSLEVHEESLSIVGEPDQNLTDDFHERSEEIYTLLANQIIDSPGGSSLIYESAIPRLDTLRRVSIHPVAEIQVRITLRIDGSRESRDISNAPPLYLSNSNAVIYVRNDREAWLSIFSAILFEFIPRLTTDQILDSASKFLIIMKMDQRDLMHWLVTNGFIKHDISPPRNFELKPSTIDIKNKDEIQVDQADDDYTVLDDEDLTDPDDTDVETIQNEKPDSSAIGISTSSASEPKRNFPISKSEVSHTAPSAATPHNLTTRKDNLADFIAKSETYSTEATERVQSESAEPQPLGANIGTGSRKQNFTGKRRRSGFAHAEAEKGDGLTSIHNAEVDKAGVEWVKEKEWEIRRKVVDMNETVRNHKGFDLMSISDSDPNDIRLIEVKSCAGYWPELGVGLSRAQFEIAIVEGFQSWLYVVENAMESDNSKRLHRIQNPWGNIRSVYFDPGWRDIAEVSAQQNPVSLVKGLRVRHQVDAAGRKGDGLGWIASEPTRQGQSIHCLILFDDTLNEKMVRWDDRYFEVVTGEDDNS